MRWIFWILGVLAGILILVTLIGYLLPKEHTVTREARFHQPQEVVWKTITDIDAMPSWRQGLRSVTRLHDKSGLPAWVETLDSGIIPLETVASLPPATLIVRIADPSCRSVELGVMKSCRSPRAAASESAKTEKFITQFFEFWRAWSLAITQRLMRT